MWDPLSYIYQAVGSKHTESSSATLPSFYEYTTRPFLLKKEEEQLHSKMAAERVAWKSLSLSFCGKDYAAHYSSDRGSEEFVQDLRVVVKSIEDDLMRGESIYSGFLEQVDKLQKEIRGAAVDVVFDNDLSVDTLYIREGFLCCELRKRLRVPATVSTLLLERGSFHFLIKGEGCTVCMTAMIDNDGAPVHYEGVVLESDTLCCSNGICRSGRGSKDRCFVTVFSGDEMGCAAGLLLAEGVVGGEHVEKTLRTLVDAGVLVCFSSVYNDGSVCQYEQHAQESDISAVPAAAQHYAAARRTRVVRCSRNADAMHLLNADVSKGMPPDVAALDLALRSPPLVATMQTVPGPSYFEVVRCVGPLGVLDGPLALSIAHDSPLHNNVLKHGDTIVLFHVADQDVWKKGPSRQWLVPARCDAAKTKAGCFSVPRCCSVAGVLLFTTERSFSAGDSAVVIGKLADANRTEQPLCAPFSRFSSLFHYTPFVCKFLHRQHGPIGFVGFSFAFCSTAPLLAMALLPLHVTDFISSETDVDPTITLFFFRREYGGFSVRNYPYFTDALPCPLHRLIDEKTSLVAGTATCRLLQVESLLGESSTFMMLSVSRVAFDGSDILQFGEC
ncbi:conserved hypothetical protein [Leishmania major strain Friedlin]|uniref:Uncharacterized protein n=1 Tax=Leishmania major TaxID=5664 RepID=Q4QBH6_LEIMA|nr:conserved hypothetical protein [Leishmania major strain Friedlin]CAG9574064.1 hypothetical_protein_-_conserved [Leishmania major strain Friedlin]CAJ03807.1 conserved hypothetical protein [Leishmania major strain Friedlin]|eukprot:XP_001683322.1 conserved hypothetical protein [Leishmania major strain Friedlin]